jgi:uncharacterized protein HemX
MGPEETVLSVYDDPPPPPTPKRAHKGEGTPMPETTSQEQEAAPEATDETTATTTDAPAAPTADDLAKLAQAAGGDTTLTIVLAIVAVVGGGAAFKFYSTFSEQKHEQAMKKLELEAKLKGADGTQPQACQNASAKVETDLTEIRNRLAAVEKKTASVSADFDGDDLERQLKKLAKTVKAMQEERS